METLEELTVKYQQVTKGVIDYEKYNLYAISHHSTVIEGNTLTEVETQVFLDQGLTAKGKPLMHHLMVKNHLEALQFVVNQAHKKTSLTLSFIKQVAAIVMKDTGTVHNTVLGNFDTSKGDLRLLNVSAGIGGKSYMNYSKVPQAMKELCQDFESHVTAEKLTTNQVNDLAFLLHYQFVTIHPFADGNGRTGRLLMNYIQAFYGKPLTVLFSQNKTDYINALVETRREENIEIFLDFMREQHISYLQNEIARLLEPAITRKYFGGVGLFF
ncbi:Fic family protein [Dyadobacter sp. NIV53]|uniref:Fic family protein n=1 Tax=Dyadobacter sp. NIV53 TaxID=2861765 RepID=UPI001C8511D9|nr:Fic family protein [Dyadobacter sp. NIV53]